MLIVSIMGEDLAALSRALSIAAWEHKYKDIRSLKKNLRRLPLGAPKWQLEKSALIWFANWAESLRQNKSGNP